jgi:hypothetical protein
MNKRTLPIGIAFLFIGISLTIVFKNSTPGTFGGVLLIIVGIVLMIQSKMSRG